ncbi:MAG: hypothetical protein ACKOFG_15300, partial [Limnohabitans sp.]
MASNAQATPTCRKHFILCPVAHQLHDEDSTCLPTDFYNLDYFTNLIWQLTKAKRHQKTARRRLAAFPSYRLGRLSEGERLRQAQPERGEEAQPER